MSGRENQDHWGLLASDLGIDAPKEDVAPLPLEDSITAGEGGTSKEPAEEAAAPQIVASEPEVERAPALEPRLRVSAPPKPRRPAADWTQLASSLGIAPPEEPAPLAPPVESEPAAGPVRGEPVEQAPEEAPVRSEEIAEGWTESVIELMEGSDEVVATPSAPPEARPEADERRPDRRKRRRRRRSRRPADGETDAERGEGSEDQFASEAEEGRSEAEAEPQELPEQAERERPPAAGEPQAERPKRRRRRRGDRRRERDLPRREGDAATEDVASPGDVDLESPLPPREEDRAGLAEPDEGLDEHEEDLDEIDKTDKDGHRAIPSWEEAISHIVSRNLEARARKPDSGSSRPRGGRGRGRT